MWIHKNKNLIIFVCILMIGILGMSGCGNKKETITVFAAASLTESMKEIKEVFEKEHPNMDIQLNLDSSSRLRVQLEQGVDADIYLSANQKHYDRLDEQGMIDSGKHFLSNSMVLIVPTENPAQIEKLENLVNECKLVIAQKEVPAGNYALQILENLNNKFGKEYKKNVLENVVSQENNVKQVVAKVVLGEADAAFVYASDVTTDIKEKVKVIKIPEKYNVKATYWGGTIKKSENNKMAKVLYDMIIGEKGLTIFEKYGFEMPEI